MASLVTPQRITRFIQARFNPIRSLTPEWLSQMLDGFDAGYLREFALMAEAIENRDDVLMSVAPKRKKAVARSGYEIITTAPRGDKAAERKAQQHKECLEHFYGHLTAVNALRLDERGGLRLLVKQMADAIGKRYAVHEIVWKPTDAGLTAELRFVPLWFFENRTGRLRYLPQEGMIDGVDLDPNGWMVTVGDGLMFACSIAYMFKNLPLKDWLVYCERFGLPIPIGATKAAKDSPEWQNMLNAVESIMSGAAAVKNDSESIELLETKGSGELPHPKLVERMDRAMSAMWRGSDLSTMSRGGSNLRSTGASVQGDEGDILEVDDTEMISETLNVNLSRFVIRYTFGDDEPLAFIQLLTGSANQQNVDADIKVDTFLRDSGFPLDLQSVSERYGRPLPEGADAEQLLISPLTILDAGGDGENKNGGGDGAAEKEKKEQQEKVENSIRHFFKSNDELRAFMETPAGKTILSNAIARRSADQVKKNDMINVAATSLGAARKRDLASLATRLTGIFALPDDVQTRLLHHLRSELPAILRNANTSPRQAAVIADTLSAALFNGFDDAAQLRSAVTGNQESETEQS